MNPFSRLESIYDHEYEYISFLACEYEYIYPLGEVNMGPISRRNSIFYLQNKQPVVEGKGSTITDLGGAGENIGRDFFLSSRKPF